MLVLSRKKSEVILVGPDIRITIVKFDRNQVRVGIEAPGEVAIVREELITDADEREAKAAWVESDRAVIERSAR